MNKKMKINGNLQNLSRRDFLKLVGVGAGAALLNACAPKILSPTPVPRATISPTATSVPTITPTAIPTPDFSELLMSEIALYAAAWGYNEQEVSARTTIVTMADSKDNQFKVAVDPQTSIPLLVTNENKQWQRASLKALADRAKMTVGVSVDYNTQLSLLKREFNYGLISSGWGWSTQPDSRSTIRFNFEDGLIRLSQEQGIDNFRLMHILCPNGGDVPEWLRKGNFSKKELTGIVTNYITTVMNHFRGIVQEYVVVNEPYRDGDLFRRVIGPEYVDIAFQAAREANPRASLVFNETDNHRSNGYSTSWTREIVGRLKSEGLIDKVGLQMHLERDVIGDPGDVTKTIQDYDLPASVTEFDYDIRHLKGTSRERFTKQGEVYERVLGAAISGGVKDIGFWGGAYDKFSWKEQPEFNGSPDADPTMWDDDGNPKPAYYAVTKVLLGAVGTRII